MWMSAGGGGGRGGGPTLPERLARRQIEGYRGRFNRRCFRTIKTPDIIEALVTLLFLTS